MYALYGLRCQHLFQSTLQIMANINPIAWGACGVKTHFAINECLIEEGVCAGRRKAQANTFPYPVIAPNNLAFIPHCACLIAHIQIDLAKVVEVPKGLWELGRFVV